MGNSTVFVAIFILVLSVTCNLVVMSEGFSIPAKRQDRCVVGAALRTTLKSKLHPNNQQQQFQQQQQQVGQAAFVPRGGAGALSASSTPTDEDGLSRKKNDCPVTTPFAIFGSLWGSLGVIYILAKAIKRVTPIALEPFGSAPTLTLTPFQWSMYVLNCLFFAYAEGYKGFQLKFSPLVVKRSFTLVIGTPQGNNPLNFLLAPLYSMGLINATKKRLITSWCVTLGVAAIVAAVKRLPPVWRCIMDAGVVVGLSWGTLSILYYYIKSMVVGKTPDVDACLPMPKKA